MQSIQSAASPQPVRQPSASARPLMHSAEPVDNTCDKRNDLAFSAPSRWRDEVRVRIQKTCWPRCRYRTMVLMMGSSAEQQPDREREQEQEPDSKGCVIRGGMRIDRCGVASKKVKRGLLQQIAEMPSVIINNFIFLPHLCPSSSASALTAVKGNRIRIGL